MNSEQFLFIFIRVLYFTLGLIVAFIITDNREEINLRDALCQEEGYEGSVKYHHQLPSRKRSIQPGSRLPRITLECER